MKKKVTMQDIADNLELSKSIVSRALGDKYGVNEKTKALIKNEAKRLGYIPPSQNINKDNFINTISVFMLRTTFLNTSFGAKIISGIERAINKRYMKMSLTLLDRETSIINIPTDLTIRGIILTVGTETMLTESIENIKVPIVIIDPLTVQQNLNTIMVDNYGGMYVATEYLISMGHRRFVFVGTTDYSLSFIQRYHGCRDCIEKQKHLDVQGRYVVSHGEITFNEKEFIDLMKSDFGATGILCANDPTAIEVYRILKELDLKVPDDVSVIGFDNISETQTMNPPLTTLHISKTKFGEFAVSMLLDESVNTNDGYQIRNIGVNLIKRDSVKKC